MAVDNVNLDALKPYKTSKYESFEMLWYQLCNELFSNKGTFTPIDDSGGGDGVEFYLKLPNGDIWGWQCKFFDRFSESGRKNQITKSLKKAYQEHGTNLKKWYLCSKSDCTKNERDWFNETLPKICNVNGIALIHWGESELLDNLRKHPDIDNFFFGKDKLPLNWFEIHAESVFSRPSIKSKYIPDVHTKGNTQDDLYYYIGGIGLSNTIENEIELGYIDEAIEIYPKILLAIRKLDLPSNLQQMKEDIISHILKYDHIFEDGKSLLIDIQSRLSISTYGTPFLCIYDSICEYYERAMSLINWVSNFINSETLQNIENLDIPKENSAERIKSKYKIILTIENYLDNIIGVWKKIAYIFSQLKDLDNYEIHIKGEAAKGKSHLVINVFDQYRTLKLPAVYLSAKEFSTNDQIDVQLMRILDLPKSWSMGDFLEFLNQSGKNNGCKTLLIIDGLNESPYYQTIWKNGLENLIAKIKQHSSILLITTFRSSYQSVLFDKSYPYRVVLKIK